MNKTKMPQNVYLENIIDSLLELIQKITQH